MAKRITHGMSDTGLYHSWRGMHYRVANRYGRSPTYVNVKICDEWSTFEGFLANPPRGEWSEGMQCARDGDEGPYAPWNCEWKTRSENAKEAADRKKVVLECGAFGIDVAAGHGISRQVFNRRVRAGMDPEDAARVPIGEVDHDGGADPIYLAADGRPGYVAAEENGITRVAFYQRVNAGWGVERASTEPMRDKEKYLMPDGRPGLEVARENGIGVPTFYGRVDRGGWSVERAATTDPNEPTYVMADGRDAVAVAVENGLKANTFHVRLQRGWLVEDAATLPPRSRKPV